MSNNRVCGRRNILPHLRAVSALVVNVMFIFLLALAGCTAPQGATPQPTAPQPATETAAPVAAEKGGATSVATAAPAVSATAGTEPTAKPSVAAKPTSKPLPPQPPRLVQRTPAPGEELAPSEAIVLRFDQAMDESSVNKAFIIEPKVPGKLSWDDPSTIRFVPQDSGFTRDSTYRISVDTTARSATNLPLARPVRILVQTVGYLQVTNVSPADKSTEVASNSVIRVFFNRPVVPLISIQAQKDLPQPLAIEPVVQGRGEWTNTSIYTFTPNQGLAPGTAYRVTVKAGLTDTTGGILQQDYTWSFTTDVPRVVSVFPENGTMYVAPQTGIKVTFSQPMQAGPTQQLFTLTPKGKSPGSRPVYLGGTDACFHTHTAPGARRALRGTRRRRRSSGQRPGCPRPGRDLAVHGGASSGSAPVQPRPVRPAWSWVPTCRSRFPVLSARPRSAKGWSFRRAQSSTPGGMWMIR